MKVARGSIAPTPVHVPTSTARLAAPNTDRQSFNSAKPAPQTEALAPIIESAPENNNVHEEGISILFL